MFCAMAGRTEIARLLVEMKADVAARDECDDTAHARPVTRYPRHSLDCREGVTALGIAIVKFFPTQCDYSDVEAYFRSIGAPGED